MNYKTYALVAVVVTAAGLISATVTVTDAQKEKWAEITGVKDGEYWMPFKDGMMIDETMPKFRGTSGGMESIQVTLNGEQVGNNNKIGDAGKWTKQQQWPLEKGEYHIVARDCGPLEKGKTGACAGRDADGKYHAVLFNGTIHVGRQAAAAAGDPDAVEAMKLRISELQAVVAAMNATITGMLERMDRMQEPVEITALESDADPYYVRLVDPPDDGTYNLGDTIRYETNLPACGGRLHDDYHNGTANHDNGHTVFALIGGWRGDQSDVLDCPVRLVDASAGRTGMHLHSGGYDGRGMSWDFDANHTSITGLYDVTPVMTVGEYHIQFDVHRPHITGERTSYHTDTFTVR